MNPINQLKRLRCACDTRTLPPDLADWLRDCLESAFSGPESLDQAFGLTGGAPGKRAAVNGERLRRRDQLIRDIAIWSGEECPGDQAKVVAAYLQGGPAPMPISVILEELLRYDPPRSARQLHRILQGDRGL